MKPLFVQTCFCLAVRHLNVSPSEFWRMKPRHFWWLYRHAAEEKKLREQEMDERGGKKKGLSESEAKDLLKLVREANA